ncbi:hypothetical protein AAHD35_03370 [Enterobacter roggenkampii]|uniref:hypothetical protein n=1 Tax=Enterobacter roggenkampii TaxID=1812935 RepID=UPI00396705A8
MTMRKVTFKKGNEEISCDCFELPDTANSQGYFGYVSKHNFGMFGNKVSYPVEKIGEEYIVFLPQ